MELEIVAFYCLCDDFLNSYGVKDDHQTEMSTAEVMTTALTAAAFFGGDHEKKSNFPQRIRLDPGDALRKSVQPPSSSNTRITPEILYGHDRSVGSFEQSVKNIPDRQLPRSRLSKYPDKKQSDLSGGGIQRIQSEQKGVFLWY